MHTSGSHQNVITTRLMENMDFANVTLKILDIDDFPTGVKYHHDKPYMRRLAEGKVKPYNFHMCWTSNKGQKVEYFKNTKMWYLQDQCENSGVMPHHTIFQNVVGTRRTDKEQQWKELSSACCKAGGL